MYKGVLIYAGRYDTAKAELVINRSLADKVGFGRTKLIMY